MHTLIPVGSGKSIKCISKNRFIADNEDSLSHWYYPASPHRRFWNWVEYIFFFYDAIIGIVASIFRILPSFHQDYCVQLEEK